MSKTQYSSNIKSNNLTRKSSFLSCSWFFNSNKFSLKVHFKILTRSGLGKKKFPLNYVTTNWLGYDKFLKILETKNNLELKIQNSASVSFLGDQTEESQNRF